MTLEKGRIIQYVATLLILTSVPILFSGSIWFSGAHVHTILEVIATIVALFVGVLALIHHYTKRNNLFLFIGAGFLGTAFLDGYHAVVTSNVFDLFIQSAPESVIPWSWIVSRLFLSIILFIGLMVWYRVGNEKINESFIYISIGLLAFISFIIFILVPLPRAYYPELFFGRPEELVPALFFLITLVGYFLKVGWKKSYFDHWLMMSLIVAFMSQVLFMAFSTSLFDYKFDSAHILKIISYVFVLTGLLISMFNLFKKAEEGKDQLEIKNIALEEARKAADLDREIVIKAKSKLEKAFDVEERSKLDLERINEKMVGREIKMLDLKREIEELKSNK